jgi:hypothetical protein
MDLNKKEIWFSNLDMDSAILIETMIIQDGKNAWFLEHPGLGNFILYGLGLKIFHLLELSDFSSYSSLMQLDANRQPRSGGDPLLNLPDLYYNGRIVSIAIAILTAIFFGLGAYFLTASPIIGFLTSTCCMLSSGLLLQSLMIRTELSSVLFGSAAFSFFCFSFRTKNSLLVFFSVFLSGTALGISVLTKMVTIPLLIPLVISVALINHKPKHQSIRTKTVIGLLICGISVFVFYYFQIRLVNHILQDQGLSLFLEVRHGFWTVPAICVTAILTHLVSLKWPSKMTAIAGSTTGVLLGFLIAIPIAFWFTNIDFAGYDVIDAKEQSRHQLVVLRNAFSFRYLDSNLVTTSDSGIFAVIRHWREFIMHSLTESYVLLFAILGIISAKTNKIRVSIILLIASGLGMSLVMSIRYINPQYLIYQEVFLITAGALGFGEKITSQKYELTKHLALIGILMIILLSAGAIQKHNTKEIYSTYNLGSRNWITNVSKCIYAVWLFETHMIGIYGSNEKIVRRIIEDNRLNGSERGINILDLPRLRKHLSNAKIDI